MNNIIKYQKFIFVGFKSTMSRASRFVAFLSFPFLLIILMVCYKKGYKNSSGKIPSVDYKTIHRPTIPGGTGYKNSSGKIPSFDHKTIHTIHGGTDLWQGQLWKELLMLDGCKYTNCITTNSTSGNSENADIILFAKKKIKRYPAVRWSVRQRQYWIILSYESSAYSYNLFKKDDNLLYNATMMYRRDSRIYYPWGKAIAIKEKKIPSNVNFAEKKTKSAFAYVYNCHSKHYNRLQLFKELGMHIQVDAYSSTCPDTKKPPCPRLDSGKLDNPECEKNLNKDYRFFLAFENSLCKDYITEKFWDRLKSPSYFLPVVMGGLSIEDYTSIAPPNSFLHVSNFTSVKALGEYLTYLSENDYAFNKYHQWRYDYRIDTGRNMGACELCRIANERPVMPAIDNIDNWFNDPSRCRTYEIH